MDTAAQRPTPAPEAGRPPRALVWDGWSTSSLLAARSLAAAGLAVDFVLPPASPWIGLLEEARPGPEAPPGPPLERLLFGHPLDVLCLHGDDQVRWLLERAERLPERLRRHLAPLESLAIALSKERTLAFARGLGLPVPETVVCATWREARDAARRLGAAHGAALVKPVSGSAGRGIRAVGEAGLPEPAWRELLGEGPVLVQPLLRGPRAIATVVCERGNERAACVHEKVRSGPGPFGITAVGLTRHIPAVHDQARALFRALGWHGPANAEFRQGPSGRWLLMEINPRVPSSIGIQARAGLDVVRAWADVCLGRPPARGPRAYREGVRYAWVVPDLARRLRSPWRLAGAGRDLGPASDWAELNGPQQRRALRLAAWSARAG